MPRRRHSIDHPPSGGAATSAAASSTSSSGRLLVPIQNNGGAAADHSSQQLAADYLHLFETSAEFSDVVFLLHDHRPVPAHRCVLSARSSFFHSLFRRPSSAAAAASLAPLYVPVDAVGYDAFVAVLRFLYSGRLILHRSDSADHHNSIGSSRSFCRRSSLHLALQTLHAASFFGIHQLSLLIQAHLEAAVGDGLIGAADGMDDGDLDMDMDVFAQILTAAKTHGLESLFRRCALAVPAASAVELRLSLPPDIAAEIDDIRARTPQLDVLPQLHKAEPPLPPPTDSTPSCRSLRRMRQALDSMDMELLGMIVLGEGLDLDDAGALHYAVTNCGRQAAKALLEMGAVDVNQAAAVDGRRRTALQLACEMADPDLISLLLNYGASPSIPSAGAADNPLNIIRAAIIAAADRGSGGGGSGSAEASQFAESRLRLCLELLQSAALVEARGGYGGGGGGNRWAAEDGEGWLQAAAAERSSVEGQQNSSERGGGGGGGGGGSTVESCSCSSSRWGGGGEQAATPHSALQPNHGLPLLDFVVSGHSQPVDLTYDVRVHNGQNHDDHSTFLEDASPYYNNHNAVPTTFFPIYSPSSMTPDTATTTIEDNYYDDQDQNLDAFQELDQSPLLLLPTHPLHNPTPPQPLSAFTNFPYNYAHPHLAQPQGSNPFSYHLHHTTSSIPIHHFSLYCTTSTP